ncbi:putative ABC transport system permease protein [Murinocardiopsis flavida]|uniref:Putative ABC transport system permease protein n=1 Tax=Murinocardiopsis flavida TaxID=645275 RepID=A0A2P8CW10_9ACTN|nr:ABC transporter permease [Murinocardiopsis flavida]PSK89137.1 putative ABC transport system permease protein [Murinocardiopsis flavida]
MIWATLSSARERWASFAGTFVVLCLSVSLISAVALTIAAGSRADVGEPRRYADAPVVVAPDRTAAFDEEPVSGLTTGTIPEDLVDRLREGGTEAVADREGYAQLVVDGDPDDGPAPLARPWSAARLSPYELVDGDAPGRDADSRRDIVVAAGTGLSPGADVRVLTARGSEPFTVTGTYRAARTASAPRETPVFVSDSAAERLAPGVHAIGVYPGPGVDAGAVAEVVRGAEGGAALEVLTGDERKRAEPNPDADLLGGMMSMLGMMALITTFVAVFVIASTFAFSAAQRRREFALLRALGATPRQVSAVLFTEALAVAVTASGAGAVLGKPVADQVVRLMRSVGIAPDGFSVDYHPVALAVAFCAGFAVALLGVWAAARRTRRIRPLEALREAAVDPKAMTLGRWFFGLAFAAGSVGIAYIAVTIPGDGAIPMTMLLSMSVIVAVALLGPVVVPPVGRLLTAPMGRLPGAEAMLIRENMVAGVRRTASLAAPVVVTVGLCGSMLGLVGSATAAEAKAEGEQTPADLTVVSAAAPGLPAAAAGRLREVDGVRATPMYSVDVLAGTGGQGKLVDATVVGDDALPHAVDPPMLAGSLADLGSDMVAVGELDRTGSGRDVGDPYPVRLPDGTTITPEIGAVVAEGITPGRTYLPRSLVSGHTDNALVSQINVEITDGSAPAEAERRIAAALDGFGASVRQTSKPAQTAQQQENDRMTLMFGSMLLGLAVLCSCLAIANTLLMSTSERRRDFATLQLAGAHRGQVLRMVALEAVCVVALGALLGLAATGGVLLALRSALSRFTADPPIVLPWEPMAGIIAVCLLLALVASLVPARLVMRTRPVELAGVRE